jgi:uncharacterized membrane protein
VTEFLERLHRFRQTDGWIFGTMLFSACISLLASFVLSIDAVELARDPNVALSCNISAVISCGTVGVSWQAALFGFPNAFLGLVAEPVVAQIVYFLGFIFAYWLFFQAMFVIGALCPWCLLVTLSTTLVFTTLTHVNIRDNNLYLPPRAIAAARTGLRLGLDALIATVLLAAVVALILWKYGSHLFA